MTILTEEVLHKASINAAEIFIERAKENLADNLFDKAKTFIGREIDQDQIIKVTYDMNLAIGAMELLSQGVNDLELLLRRNSNVKN